MKDESDGRGEGRKKGENYKRDGREREEEEIKERSEQLEIERVRE